jgi:hypothetical protein
MLLTEDNGVIGKYIIHILVIVQAIRPGFTAYYRGYPAAWVSAGLDPA